MSHVRLFPVALALASALACGGASDDAPAPPSLEEQASAKCPRVHMDKMAGDWILATGDPKTRMRVLESGGETLLWYIDPAFSNHKLELVGTKRDSDWRFDERPRGARKRLVEEGGAAKKRVYLDPKVRKCAVEVVTGTVDDAGEERIAPKAKEFLQFPEQQGVVFSYRPHDAPLFVGEAATDKAKADAQVEELGEPRRDAEMGTVPVGGWSAVADDGETSCTYTFDAYFDHRPVDGAQGVEVAAVEEGAEHRHWTHTFEAPYTGNHTFELFRYRTCDGGERELLGVMGIDAALM